jgi:hypothetical protein
VITLGLDTALHAFLQSLLNITTSKERMVDYLRKYFESSCMGSYADARLTVESAESKGEDAKLATEAKEPLIEMDSTDGEEVLDLPGLLLPPGFTPLLSMVGVGDKFSISYSARALQGWVKQPSPCCAAASAAGAWNASRGFGRNDPRAQSHLTMVPYFIALLTEQSDAIKVSCGLPPIDGAIVAVAWTTTVTAVQLRSRFRGHGRWMLQRCTLK